MTVGADMEGFAACNSDSSDETAAEVPRGARRSSSRVARYAVGGALGVGVALCVLGVRASSGPSRAQGGFDPSGTVVFNADGQASVAAAVKTATDTEMQGYQGVLKPAEDTHDGNPCASDEELHAGLCYQTCSLLTSGQYQVRQSAFACCETASCPPFKFFGKKCCKTTFGMCTGHDIAGMREGTKICPHKPGACLADEEMYLDVCYMKCSLLTQGKYPHRTASATCCKTTGMACLAEDGASDGFNGQSITHPTLAVGGGCGDQSNTTHCKPHVPQQSVTEA